MSKKEFTDGWKHFCSRIDWDKTFLDAEAIQFMNTGIGEVFQAFQQRDDLLALCKELVKKAENQYASTSETLVKFGSKVRGICVPLAKAAIAKCEA